MSDPIRLPLTRGQVAIVDAADAGFAAYPEPIDREQVRDTTNYKRSSSDTFVQRLRSRQLLTEAGHRQVRASETLFDGAR